MKTFFKLLPLVAVACLLIWGGYGTYKLMRKMGGGPKVEEVKPDVKSPPDNIPRIAAVTDLDSKCVKSIRGVRITGGFLSDADEVIRKGMESSLGFVSDLGRDWVEVYQLGKKTRVFVDMWESVTARFTGSSVVDGVRSVSSSLGLFTVGLRSPLGGQVVSVSDRLAEIRYDDGGGVIVRFNALPEVPVSSQVPPPGDGLIAQAVSPFPAEGGVK